MASVSPASVIASCMADSSSWRQPGDVDKLLDGLGEPLGDAGAAISRLYGRPTVNREELVEVDREGIKEWRRWRQSLEELGAQSWRENG
jgi:hypothetical protein